MHREAGGCLEDEQSHMGRMVGGRDEGHSTKVKHAFHLHRAVGWGNSQDRTGRAKQPS